MPAVTIFSERTLSLPRRSIWNPVRRLLGRPLQLYTSHLFADAVICTEPGSTTARPNLAIETGQGGVLVRLTVPHDFQGTVSRLSLRERGADRPVAKVRQVIDRLPDPKAEGWSVSPGGGRLRDPVTTAVLAGKITVNDAREVLRGDRTLEDAIAARADADLKYAAAEEPQTWPPEPEGEPPLPQPVTREGWPQEAGLPSTSLDALVRRAAGELDGGLDGGLDLISPAQLARMNEPGHYVTPTDTTTVMADLAYIADVLETAQFQIAMTPGGADEGSTRNEAHAALCAVQLVQAKLAVVAEAADLATGILKDRLKDVGEGREKRPEPFLNRSLAMLRQVTERLPLPPESPHVRF